MDIQSLYFIVVLHKLLSDPHQIVNIKLLVDVHV